MSKKVSKRVSRSVNNRPNCLKATKRRQKLNIQTTAFYVGSNKKTRTSARELRNMNHKTSEGQIFVDK